MSTHHLGFHSSSPAVRGSYQSVPEDADTLDKLQMDIDDPEPTILRQEKKGTRHFAFWGGTCIVLTFLLLISGRAAIQIFMPSISIYQTSLLWKGDRMTYLDSAAMRDRGFDVGAISFGNTDCSKVLEAINTVQGYVCRPPSDGQAAHLTVDKTKRYQEIIGFGGAFTETAAVNFYKLPADVQGKVAEYYFGEEGIGYTLGRVPINSCDFSEASYSFDEVKGDYDLLYFDTELTHDEAAMLPFLRLAMKTSGHKLRVVASPWSPPKWMKKPIDGIHYMNGSVTPIGLLEDAKTKTAWAKYISLWVTSYSEKGVPIWAVTPQNEPEFPAPWEACAWDEVGERDWVADYLGPILRQFHPDLLILAYDHNKDHLFKWANALLDSSTSRAAEWIDGMAFHWYTGGNDRFLDGTFGYTELNRTHHAYPDKLLLATEGCSCPDVWLDDWRRAEILAHDVMSDLSNFAQGWIDWNLIVDSKGGFNHLGNMCDAPMVASPDFQNVHLQPKFYYMGHISKYIPPGSIRIKSEIIGNYGYNTSVDANVRVGYEMAVFPCEKSTRQMFTITTEGYLSLSTEVQDTEAQHEAQKLQSGNSAGSVGTDTRDDVYVQLCVSSPSDATQRLYLNVVQCDGSQNPMVVHYDPVTGHLQDKRTNKCVSLADGSTEAGALLLLQDCLSSVSSALKAADTEHQKWVFNAKTKEVTILKSELCLTVGWPLLTAVAFQRPTEPVDVRNQDARTNTIPLSAGAAAGAGTDAGSSGATGEETGGVVVIVLLNEASVETAVVLHDSDKGSAWFGISGKAMQTIMY
jgi:glucosylceramidase